MSVFNKVATAPASSVASACCRAAIRELLTPMEVGICILHERTKKV
jgi:hypothetical protein